LSLPVDMCRGCRTHDRKETKMKTNSLYAGTRKVFLLEVVVAAASMLFITTGFAAGIKADTLWHDDFEDQNWFFKWSVSAGTWEVGVPMSGPNNAYSGTRCAATILTGNYPPGANTRLERLTSFVVPSSSEHPRLRFWHWFQFENGDYGQVEIKVGNGSWKPMPETYSWYSTKGWTYALIDLTPYADSTVQIGFFFHSDAPGDVGPGWYIDDVGVYTGQEVFNNPEGFELGIGDWAADRGTWEVGIPIGGPDTAHTGNQCAVTGLLGLYDSRVNSRLVSPPILLDSSARLLFWHRFSFSSGDYGQVQLRVLGGTWASISDKYVNTSNNWSPVTIPLPSYKDSVVQIAFVFRSDAPADVSSGWYVDDVQFYNAGPTCSFNKSTVSFGLLGKWQSKTDSVKVTNTGGDTLRISSVVSRHDAFAVTPTSATIAPSQSQQFYVTFTAKQSGNVSSNIAFAHNAAGGSDSIKVRGGAWDRLVWIGIRDKQWSSPENWSRNDTAGAVPASTDSVIIRAGTPYSPEKAAGYDYVGALNVDSGATFTLLPGSRIVVNSTLRIEDGCRMLIQSSGDDSLGGDMVINGTLEVEQTAAPVIRTSRSWTRGPSSVFIPGRSIIPFSGSGSLTGNFNSIRLEQGSAMQSIGNVTVAGQCEVRKQLQLRHMDTLTVDGADPQDLFGTGRILGGTIGRTIGPNKTAPYRFGSDSVSITFLNAASYPEKIWVRHHVDFDSLMIIGTADSIPSVIDTVTHTIRTDSTFFDIEKKFVIIRPVPREARSILTPNDAVNRVYQFLWEDSLVRFPGRMSLEYDPSEVPAGVAQSSLRMYWVNGTIAGVEQSSTIPTAYELSQNYPNPFNPSTTIRYLLPTQSKVTLRIFDILGRQVRTLIEDARPAGTYVHQWDGRNSQGIAVSSGVYFYRIEVTGSGSGGAAFRQVKKMMLLK
jgi:hypothetical protein